MMKFETAIHPSDPVFDVVLSSALGYAQTPRLANGRADFSGLWRPADIFLIEDTSLGLKSAETVPANPWRPSR
jgi:hypothetical protein